MSFSPASPDSIAIFFSYANEDEGLCEKLERHLSPLKRQKIITCWRRSRLVAGNIIPHEVDKHLQAAQIILLLISSSFMASDECYHEMQVALERHKSGQAYTIPILLKPVSGWQDTPLGEFAVLPDNGKAITRWSERDLALTNVVDGIRKVSTKISVKRALASSERRGQQRIIEYPPLPHPKITQPRDIIVKEIYAKLLDQSTSAVVLTGITGAGKSTLANLLYHYTERERHANNGPFTGETLKLRIDPAVTLFELVETLSEVTGEPLSDRASISQQDLPGLLFRIVNNVPDPRLIIIDQCENLFERGKDGAVPSGVREWLHLLNTHLCRCRIVFVSRIRLATLYDDAAQYIHEYHTNGLEIEAGIELLRSWDIGASPSELQAIVEHFEGHALALSLFASISHSYGQSIDLLAKDRAALGSMEEITRCIEEIYVHRLKPLERDLLFAFSLYREPRPLDAALALLAQSVTSSSKNAHLALESLSAYCLLQQVNHYYQPHALVTDYIHNRASERNVRQDSPNVLLIAHEKAAGYCQQRASARSPHKLLGDIDASHDLIEATWHFCQARQWQRAYMVMCQENIVPHLLRVGKALTLLELYQQFLPLQKWNAQSQQAAHVLKDLGMVCDRLGRKDEARQHFEQALDLFREAGERQQEASTLIHLGEALTALEVREQALSCYEQAVSICDEEGVSGEQNKAIALNDLGKLAYEQGQKEQSLAYYTQALLLHTDIGEEATTLNNLAGLYEELDKPSEAYRYYQKAFHFFREIGDRRGEGSALHNLGRYWRKQGKIKEAQEHYEAAWRIFREIGDGWSESVTLRNLGQLHILQENYQLALNCIFLAQKILQEMQKTQQDYLKGTLTFLSYQLGKEQFEIMWAHLEKNEQELSPISNMPSQ